MDINEYEGSYGQPQQPPVSPAEPVAQYQYTQEAGRKPSPFANSPYAAPGWQPYTPQPPVSPVPPADPTAKKKEKKGKGLAITAVAVAAAAIVICAVSLIAMNRYWAKQNTLLSQSFEEKLEILRDEMENDTHAGSGDSVSGTPNTGVDGGLTPGKVYAQNVSSVVAINCTITGSQFGQITQGTSSGSGFILTEDGYIATNYHVVEDASEISITTSDGKKYEAKFIGGDESNDIALIKAEATGLRAAVIGSSDALIVGDQVAAIGNPLGELASTLTVGYISAKDRIITTDGSQINMLQTDAAINPGNSGGPLFNMKGEVVGITSAKYSGTTSSGATIEGIGFAIPIDDVMGMLEDLRTHGYITGAYLGVSVSNMDPADAELFGLPMGVLVHDVVSGSCAQKGGVKAQDIITNVGGYDIENMNDLTRALRKFKAGETITVTVYRHGSGGEVILSLTLDEKPQTAE